MNRLVLSLFLLLLCSSATAADRHQNVCAPWEDVARAAMTARQAQVPLQTMLSLISDETAVSILRLAYEYPGHNSDKERQDTIDRFIDEVVSQCLRSSK